jgi:hypothetical protein
MRELDIEVGIVQRVVKATAFGNRSYGRRWQLRSLWAW